MKVAVIVDWLTVIGGAERVLKEILTLYPRADLYALADFLEDREWLQGRRVATSALQRLPFARHWFRSALPVMPLLIEQWRFREYDLVISCSHAVAKGIIVGPDQLHVSYIHTPMRYAWDIQDQYLKGRSGDWLRRWLLHRLRLWDQLSAARPDKLIANSHFVARRIARHWNREAEVVYPPVDIERFRPSGASEDFYLTVSRLVPYKRVDLMVEAFAGLPQKRLVVIGAGPEMADLRRRAGPNVSLVGYQPDSVITEYMQRCRAYILAAEEDFGIAPLEAQSCGKPVIALARGAAPETLAGTQAARRTAHFFPAQTTQALRQAIEEFEAADNLIEAAACRANAERFAPVFFRQRFAAHVEQALAERRRHSAQIAARQGRAGDHG